MALTIGIATALLFFALAFAHVVLAVVDRARWLEVAVPHIGNRPAFVPSRPGTLAVAFALAACALLVLGQIGFLGAVAPVWMFRTGTAVLAVLLAARAIGDFRLVGFFKRVRGSTFARLDTWIYSPLCVALATACALVAS